MTEETLNIERMPDSYTIDNVKEINPTNVAKEKEDQIRADMWRELVDKNICEGFVEIKRNRVRECIQHCHYRKELEIEVWQ